MMKKYLNFYLFSYPTIITQEPINFNHLYWYWCSDMLHGQWFCLVDVLGELRFAINRNNISQQTKAYHELTFPTRLSIGQYSICYRKRPIETGSPEWIQSTLSLSFSAPLYIAVHQVVRLIVNANLPCNRHMYDALCSLVKKTNTDHEFTAVVYVLRNEQRIRLINMITPRIFTLKVTHINSKRCNQAWRPTSRLNWRQVVLDLNWRQVVHQSLTNVYVLTWTNYSDVEWTALLRYRLKINFQIQNTLK